MASGKKNYFRHSFFARNDEFVVGLIDEFGLAGYYYYFALLEMCGEKSADRLQESYKFHRRTLIQGLRVTYRKLNRFLDYLQAKSKVRYTLAGDQYEIIIPNIAKYLGRYQTKSDPNTPNKRKEKEIKEKEIKEKEIKENNSEGFNFSFKNSDDDLAADSDNSQSTDNVDLPVTPDDYKELGFEGILTQPSTFKPLNKKFIHPNTDLAKPDYKIKSLSGDKAKSVRDVAFKLD